MPIASKAVTLNYSLVLAHIMIEKTHIMFDIITLLEVTSTGEYEKRKLDERKEILSCNYSIF